MHPGVGPGGATDFTTSLFPARAATTCPSRSRSSAPRGGRRRHRAAAAHPVTDAGAMMPGVTSASPDLPMTTRVSGVGSWPGESPREAVRAVRDLLGDGVPHLPELPGRGVGADMIGRAASLLEGLHVETQPFGWRLVDRPAATRAGPRPTCATTSASSPRPTRAGRARSSSRSAVRGPSPPPSSSPVASASSATTAHVATSPSRSPRACARTSPRSPGSSPAPTSSSRSTSPRCPPCSRAAADAVRLRAAACRRPLGGARLPSRRPRRRRRPPHRRPLLRRGGPRHAPARGRCRRALARHDPPRRLALGAARRGRRRGAHLWAGAVRVGADWRTAHDRLTGAWGGSA